MNFASKSKNLFFLTLFFLVCAIGCSSKESEKSESDRQGSSSSKDLSGPNIPGCVDEYVSIIRKGYPSFEIQRWKIAKICECSVNAADQLNGITARSAYLVDFIYRLYPSNDWNLASIADGNKSLDVPLVIEFMKVNGAWKYLLGGGISWLVISGSKVSNNPWGDGFDSPMVMQTMIVKQIQGDCPCVDSMDDYDGL